MTSRPIRQSCASRRLQSVPDSSALQQFHEETPVRKPQPFVIQALFAGLIMSSVAGAAMAQAIPSTTSKLTYVLVTSSSGQQLSAATTPPEMLTLSPNSAGWEQWQYAQDSFGNRELWSFHGTKLFLKSSRAFHAPGYLFMDSLRIESVDTTQSPSTAILTSGLTSGGTVVICAKGDYNNCLTDSGGRLTATALTDLHKIPVAAQWKLTLIGAAAGRLGFQSPVATGVILDLKSHHGDYLTAPLPVQTAGSPAPDWNSPVPVNHGASGEPVTLARSRLDKTFSPLLYGDTISIVFRPQTGDPWVVKPGTSQTSDHLEELIAQKGTDFSFTVLPVAPYQIGMRVPNGGKAILRSSKGTNLSAWHDIARLRLSPNADLWEQWTIVMR
jgi:hypothetical protein